MISTLVPIQDIQTKGRWDFPSHAPKYQQILELIKSSKWNHCTVGSVIERCEYGLPIRSGYTDEGVSVLRIQNIREYQIDFSDISYISGDIERIEKYRLEAGDVVVIRTGNNLGTAAVIPEELGGCLHSSYSMMLRPIKDKLSSEYLALILNSSLLKPQFFALKGGSTQPSINIASFKALQIPLPPLSIQKKIASVIQRSYEQAKQLRIEADKLIDEAQSRVERMILGEEGIDEN
jgi:type I restriction enzyme S subunit